MALYRGDHQSDYQDGTLIVTTHRILYIERGPPGVHGSGEGDQGLCEARWLPTLSRGGGPAQPATQHLPSCMTRVVSSSLSGTKGWTGVCVCEIAKIGP